jgi:dTDP-3-amino-2,3,6-trideoxy-4-keto-D-glucose/dTDP-3-amino-3,4,6-trideoxy-alpha-D-glucose/dTDP-2,6-dideoxy-D-kanosamine transaminase
MPTNAPKSIAMNDLGRQTQVLENQLSACVKRVLASGWYILGAECAGFESEFAAYCGTAHCISVANGTDALELAVRALGIGPGDRVATVANAGGYSTTAIRAAGAEPLYIDIDPVTMNMSASDLAGRLTSDTRAVIATHLYGRMADLPALLSVTNRAGVPLVEDCAQAHGASLGGRKAGSWGALGCFSFYPTKNLGALGDGGALTTNDEALARRVRSLRQYGWSSRYQCSEYGRNSRMDEMQAAILRVKLPYLDQWNARRREIARAYSAALAGTPVECPREFGEDNVAHLYVVRSAARDSIRHAMQQAGIATDVHYPVPDHLQAAAQGTLAGGVPLPETERAAREILTLPCHSELLDAEISAVTDALQALTREAPVV